MGWTGILDAEYKNGKIDRRATCERIFSGWTSGDKVTKLLKSCMNGTTFYAAMQTDSPNGCEVWALVVLTQTNGREFLYKEMDETEHPYNYNCPVSILDLLTPTMNESANAWRMECRKKHEEKKQNAGRIPRNATKLYITFLRDTSASKAGYTAEVVKKWDKWIYYDESGQPWRILPSLLRNSELIQIDGSDINPPKKAEEQPEPVATANNTTGEEKTAEKPQNAPAEEKASPNPSKVCYNIVIYTTPDGIKRADIRNARTNSSYMNIPAADLDAIKVEILKTEPAAIFSQSEIIPAEASTTANNTHESSPKQPHNDRQPIKYPHIAENATTGKLDRIQTARPQTRTVDSFVKIGRFSRAITRENHLNRTRYRTRGSF